nr:MAG TPA: YcgL domain protein [Caudoviricetes sp.]
MGTLPLGYYLQLPHAPIAHCFTRGAPKRIT